MYLRLASFWTKNARVLQTNQIHSVNNCCPAALRAKLNNPQIMDMQTCMIGHLLATCVLQMTKNFNKKLSVRCDQIPNCFVKSGSYLFYEVLANLLTAFFRALQTPSDWLSSRCVYFHKAGDATVFDMITSTASKLYSALLNECLTNFDEAAQILSDNQQGARPRRPTGDNISIAHQILQKCVQGQTSMYFRVSRLFQSI